MNRFFSLEGKTAVVTGGCQGIGLAIVERLGAAGARVAIGDLKDATAIAERFGGVFVRTDVSDEQQVQNLMESAHTAFGRLDVVVNNAGVHAGYAAILDAVREDYEFTFRVNTMGVVYGIKHAAPLMTEGGSIINVASAAAVTGVCSLGSYVASKFPVVGITKTAALELGRLRVRVNAICPVSVETAMANEEGGDALLEMEKIAVPLGRIARPEEVAAVVHFLAAEDSSFVNGQAINVCGGMTAGLSEQSFRKLAS
jgi:3alpha(or 20beta)-hydroxysteroid dehydrogenase